MKRRNILCHLDACYLFDRRANQSLLADTINFKTLKHLKQFINFTYLNFYCISIFAFANNKIDQRL